ncbi:hypothetical protein QBC35DRAFT_390722, partial [Podospora australis]
PAKHSLALLYYVCKQIWYEIGDSWIGQVTFSYDDVVTLMDRLTEDLDKVPLMRHIQVRSHNLVTSTFPFIWLVSLINSLPLKLDCLTILSGLDFEDTDEYRAIESFIKDRRGWRQLRFISINADAIKYSQMTLNRPQPETWRKVIQKRDGGNQNSSVTIYRADRTRARQLATRRWGWLNAILHESARRVYDANEAVPTDDTARLEHNLEETMVVIDRSPV